MYFSFFTYASGTSNTGTMIFGRVRPSSASIQWGKMAAIECTHIYCLVPLEIYRHDSSFVYFLSTYAPSSSTSSVVAAFFKVSTDGSSISLLRGFGSTNSQTYLFAYYAVGGIAYFSGLSDKSEFQVSASTGYYVVKARLDLDDGSCSSIGVHDLTIDTQNVVISIQHPGIISDLRKSS